MASRILYVDLSTGESRIEVLPDEIVGRYIGGRGINSALLFENTAAGLDPMSPANPLIFGAGMLTGMPGPAAARLTISGKSPESGLLGDSNIGGEFGAAFASTGIRHLFITGKADWPVYLLIEKHGDNTSLQIKDASHIWGNDTQETQSILKAELGDKAQIACIGQAGENLVRYACVMHGRKNAAGRTGMGCLMGTKNLKAVVVMDSGMSQPHDPEAFRELTRDINRKMKDEFLIGDMARYGTAHLYSVININIQMGRVYNGLSTVMIDEGDVSPEMLEERYYTGKKGCRSCPVRCRHSYEVKSGNHAGLTGEGPEYGVMGGVGPVIGINSVESILAINEMLNRFGMDASSTGNILAWAIEMYKEGIIGPSDTCGMELGWNDPDTALHLIEDIAFRRRFGSILADGAREASERFGEKSRDYIIWIKNLPQSDPVDLRFIKAYALGVATATRGADHLRSRCPWEAFEYDSAFIEQIYGGPVDSDPLGYKGKGRVVWWWESYLALFDALGLCKLLAFHCLPDPGVFGFEVFSRLIKAGSGLDISPEDVFKAGVGINDIERSFICREGVTRKDDYPPQRYFEPLKIQDGVDEQSRNTWLDREKYDEMLTEYYICHGWDSETGIPCV